MIRRGRPLLLPLVLLSVVIPTSIAQARELDLAPPGDHEFIRDLADMINDSDAVSIRETCDRLLLHTATPIIVVTITSMSAHGGGGYSIERFARELFDDWGIGHRQINGRDWNTGILLLISESDRKARIELGAGWGRTKDRLCQEIMDGTIIPSFKRENFSEGIRLGVTALDAMARDLELPRPPRPAWHYLAVIAFVGLAIFTAVSLARRGSSGWAWFFWAALFTAVGLMLYHAIRSSSRGGGGGFSGGSFGGGFSGGGGATGSW